VGSCGTGNDVTASVSTFFYGDEAQATVATSHPKWQQWIGEKLS